MRRRHNRQYPQSRTASAEIKRVETTQGFYTAETGMKSGHRDMMTSTDGKGSDQGSATMAVEETGVVRARDGRRSGTGQEGTGDGGWDV